MIEMPYPDFSMPYNVITLTSTLIAFIAGTMLNLLGRKKKVLGNVTGDGHNVETKEANVVDEKEEEEEKKEKPQKKKNPTRKERILMPPTKISVPESLGFEVSVHSLPRIVLSEVEQVLPSVQGKIIAVLTAQKSKYGLVEWGDEVAKRRTSFLRGLCRGARL